MIDSIRFFQSYSVHECELASPVLDA